MAAEIQVQGKLGDYLGAEVDLLRVLASGWETTVFEFRIQSGATRAELPPGRLLVLRFYQGPQAATKGAREYSVIQRLQAVRFPVPAPYLFEPDPAALGAPFLIMERLEGGPLLRLEGLASAVKTFTLAFAPFVKLHTRLHRLDPAALGIAAIGPAFSPEGGADGRPLLDRILATVAARVERGPLPWLGPALQWAVTESVRFRGGAGTVLHLDYHPLNVLVKGGRVTGVIDWVSTECGDRHLDVATTAAILSCHTAENPRWLGDNLAGNSLRRLYNALYLALYHTLMPLDFARLRYYQGLAAIVRLSTLGMIASRGAESVGYRSEASREVTRPVLKLLTRYASRKCGVPIVAPAV
ncbi:MAG: phosphotransferase family protein [Candidatus Binataceae bacterium]